MPLMEMELNKESDTIPYFMVINEWLNEKINSETIFELLDIDLETKSKLNKHISFSNEENSVVSYLVSKTKNSSPQVS